MGTLSAGGSSHARRAPRDEAMRKARRGRCSSSLTRRITSPGRRSGEMTGDETPGGAAAPARAVRIPSGSVNLGGELNLPPGARSVVLFAHGSGSSRHSPRNQYVAQVIRAAGIGTLLFDLLTPEEEVIDLRTHSLRFDIQLLAERLEDATVWVAHADETRHVRIGYF